MAYRTSEERREYHRRYYHEKIKIRKSLARNPRPVDAIDAVTRYQSSESTQEIADDYGVDKSTIRRILICAGIKLRSKSDVLSSRTGIKNPRYNGHGDIIGTKWAGIKNGALSRGLEFNISIEFAWNLFLKQNRLCALSGIPLVFATSVKEHIESICTASLDRIDSSIGYIENNVQWVHKDINNMKWTLSQDRFIELCKKVSENN